MGSSFRFSSRARDAMKAAALGLVIALGTTACTSTFVRPVVTKHGYIPDDEKVEALQPGVTTQAMVAETLGSPSSMATFDAKTWYYISSTQEAFAFLDRKTIKRDILALSFDDTGKLAGVTRYGIEDGRVVSYSGDETPTRGRELTFLEQMFGNVGRGLPGGLAGGGQGTSGPGGR